MTLNFTCWKNWNNYKAADNIDRYTWFGLTLTRCFPNLPWKTATTEMEIFCLREMFNTWNLFAFFDHKVSVQWWIFNRYCGARRSRKFSFMFLLMATFHRQWCFLREDSKEDIILFCKLVIKSNVKWNMVSLLVDKYISFHEFSLLQYLRIDSDDDGECGDLLFPCESDITDAAVVLLRKKLNGRYTLLKVRLHW